jgi:hypothetical protein
VIRIIIENEEDRRAVLTAHMDPDSQMFGGADYRIEEDHGDHWTTIGGCSTNKVTFTSGGFPPWVHAGGSGGSGSSVSSGEGTVAINIGPIG